MPIAFFGLFAGLWKLALIASGLAFVVWRKGLFRHPLFQLLLPVVRRRIDVRAAEPPRPRRGFWARVVSDRWSLALLIVVASTIVLWALARFTIHASVSPGGL
jgi:hypothetical protein